MQLFGQSMDGLGDETRDFQPDDYAGKQHQREQADSQLSGTVRGCRRDHGTIQAGFHIADDFSAVEWRAQGARDEFLARFDANMFGGGDIQSRIVV